MTVTTNRNVLRWILIFLSFVIISLILWNTYSFIQNFKAEERSKMKTWSVAQMDFNRIENLNSEVNPVTSHVVTQTVLSTPVIVIDDKGQVNFSTNVDSLNLENPKKIKQLITRYTNENPPIPIKIGSDISQTIYYGDSPLLNKLKYYPLALLLIILLFAAVVYFYYTSFKNAQQNKLWTGMAKETAHQIGTPLSSLVGWTELLKLEQVNPDYIQEIEKDINRLQTITDRFSKIGSIPTLETQDIVATTAAAYSYLQLRSSKLIQFESNFPEDLIPVNLNAQLFSWTIENLVKNAIDAMKGKGTLRLQLSQQEQWVFIAISDTGKGISKSDFKRIFEPGFTTKKRGWGLGLSLAKRIIEDYHNGKIKVLHSEIGKGTTIQITLKSV